ncbi:MAG: KR domain-containing protein, partial [Candidatus Riflebacteria bacterium]|nr:KR domain-containing protein [Candidatus Riflebacteria bacterium]
LTGIGLEVALWLARRGARHLILVSRRGPSDLCRVPRDPHGAWPGSAGTGAGPRPGSPGGAAGRSGGAVAPGPRNPGRPPLRPGADRSRAREKRQGHGAARSPRGGCRAGAPLSPAPRAGVGCGTAAGPSSGPDRPGPAPGRPGPGFPLRRGAEDAPDDRPWPGPAAAVPA